MEIAVPTLSGDGFATDIRKQADALMAYYLASDYSQSNVFLGNIMSLAYQVQEHGHDTFALKQEIERSSEEYLGRHFDTARVTVDIEDIDDRAQYNIIYNAVVTKAGLSYSLGKLIEIQNNKVVKIINIMQNGVE